MSINSLDLFKNKLNYLVKEHIPHKIEKPKDDLPRIKQEISKSKGLKRDKQYEQTRNHPLGY